MAATRCRLHARRTVRHRHRRTALGKASGSTAVRDRRRRYVDLDRGVAADRRQIGRWPMALPAGARRRPPRQERSATAGRPAIRRRDDPRRCVPPRKRASVGRAAVPVLRQPPRSRRSRRVPRCSLRGLLGSDAAYARISVVGQCAGLRLTRRVAESRSAMSTATRPSSAPTWIRSRASSPASRHLLRPSSCTATRIQGRGLPGPPVGASPWLRTTSRSPCG